MKNQFGVLPVQCKACGSTFDLWPDLLSLEESGDDMGLSGLGEKEHFCWRCRQTIFGNNSGFSENSEDLEIVENNGFELFWE